MGGRFFIPAALLLATAVSAQDFTAITRMTDRSVGRIIVDHPHSLGTGAGVVIDTLEGDLLYLTNAHVIEQEQGIAVVFKVDKEIAVYSGRVVARSSEMDLALLRLEAEDVRFASPPPPLTISERVLEKGEPVVAIGYPGAADAVLGEGLNVAAFETTVTGGSVSRVLIGSWTDGLADVEIVQHSAVLNPGNSGGPLVDRCGHVVGVNTAFARGASGIYLASSAGTIRRFLDHSGIRLRPAVDTCEAVPSAPDPSLETVGPEALDDERSLPVWAIMAGAVGLIGAGLFAAVLVVSRRGNDQGEATGGVALTLTIHDGGRVIERGIRRVSLLKGVVLGRRTAGGIDLGNARVSREHLRLSLEGRRLLATDLGSTNGTVADGRALAPHQPCQISAGSVLMLGQAVEIRLRAGA